MTEVSGFTIVLIIVVILTTLFFCYGLMKLIAYRLRRNRALREEESQPVAEAYAVPIEPIRVVLARDEEAAIGSDGSEVSKITPPAYGAWRESVRVDPDLLFWRRNDSMNRNGSDSDDHVRPASSASRRPPSYISDDGVSYVVHAEPRSTVNYAAELPIHPSEVGRVHLAQVS
ncbi:hypothetical protein GMORB2_1221 [Geosmithia morbida]|uniref:Uncharacterized protein n=1 Tax=Geosmithia morbida TaxID=1094350 RepID=A0A9P5D7P3_9HYPO|nr:uncharacterized protein GMORB2_1221 [Geosmithia morbida]KAF4125975.1 hypothetical protein GMORB2_1221 [Geosmithia morbida]